MKTFSTLFGREVKSYFYSPIAYVVLFYFLLLSGVNFWFQIHSFNNVPLEITLVEVVFATNLFWFPFILSFPLITMRAYSEEFRMGTLETLTTAPVKDWQIVLSKYCGVLFFYCVLWAPSFLSFATFKYVRLFSEPDAETGHWWRVFIRLFTANPDATLVHSTGAYWTTFVLLLLMGLFFCSIGLLASALTKDQIIGATISFSAILLCVFLPFLPMVMNQTDPGILGFFSYFSPAQHMEDFTKGILDSRPMVWYGSMAILVLIETFHVFQARKWDEGNVVYSLLLRLLSVVAIFAAFGAYKHFLPNHGATWDRAAVVGAIVVGELCLLLFYRALLGMKGRHLQIGLNVVHQVSIFWLIVIMANYISFRHFKRWDFSHDRKYELSSQTRNLLKSLPKPVNAVIFFSGAADIAPDVVNLLREYEYASNGKFKTEFVDPNRNLSRAVELQSKYKFGANENILILDIEGKSKFVNAADMADFEDRDPMAAAMGQASPRKIKDFKGEQAITSALLELSDPRPNKVYYVSGHGEPIMNMEDLAIFNESLKRQNIRLEGLNLLNVSSIPEDARALIIYGPTRDFTELEMKLLSDYWEKKGRIYLLLNPFAGTPRITDWLNGRGILPQQDRVLTTVREPKRDENNELKIVTSVVTDPVFIVAESRTSMTKDLVGMTKQLLGTTESLQVDQARASMAKIHIAPLLISGKDFWGSTDFTSGDNRTVFFDPKKDHMGPLPLALAAEMGAVQDQRVKVDSSRLVVVGNARFLSNQAYRLSQQVTTDLTVNILNWLLDREEVSGIAPKDKKTTLISLSESEVANIAKGVIFYIPGLVAVFGLFTLWQRRT